MSEALWRGYDDYIETIRSANYNFYQDALAAWFSFLNETPAFEREVLAPQFPECDESQFYNIKQLV